MEFIDTTGHVFSIESYTDDPINIKYKEGDYIFWIKDEEVSIDNYYIKPIRFIIPTSEIQEDFEDADGYDLADPFALSIKIESQFYKLLSVKSIQEKLEFNNDLKQKVEIYYDEAKSELTIDDFYWKNKENRLIVYSDDKEYYLFPFYVIAKSRITGTFLSNILIKYGNYKEYTKQERDVWLTQSQMFNYLMKQTMSDIKIYKYNQETDTKTLFYTIKTGYDEQNNEIIIPSQREMYYRIRNWSPLPADIYHYIYRLPEEYWLQPNQKYILEGEVFQSCRGCRSVIRYNHDGSMWGSGASLKKLDGTPYYPEEYTYNEETGVYTMISPAKFVYGQFSGNIYNYETTSSKSGYTIKDIPITTNNTIVRDIWFDIDNEKVTNNTDGGYITIKSYNYEYNYTQITVGATFIDECEELLINGRNIGIQLPKDIIKAIYQSSFYNKYPDEVLFKDKMKELLLNYMSIKGECGNFKSAINSLKWFGWEDKIQISQLIKTDNEFQDQYIIDYFNITNDIKETYKYFNPTNIITLAVKENDNTGEIDQQNYNNTFWGEGQPLVEDFFDKVVEVYHDDLIFYKPYYDFIFSELAIKLDCLRYYYQRYFLPLHLRILRASIEHKVYANDIKMTNCSFEKITSSPIYIPENHVRVEFPETHELLFYKSAHLIDSKFNEFSNYSNNFINEDLYYINENCIKIPIKFIDDSKRYSKNPIGEYILVNDSYFKIVQFLREVYDEDNEIVYKVASKENATHYRLSENTDILPLNKDYRYTKISSEYFNCDIILTVTTKVQNNKGHYILIDGNWKYKEKFYDNTFIEDPNGNYINLYGEYHYVNPKDRYDMITKVLIEKNSFNFHQSINQYYVNLVFIPRLMKIYNIDWLNSSYRVSVLCNNKWFTYDFTIKVPNLYLDFGRLSYRYYLKDKLSNFKQIKDIKGNQIYFNSFIYQPDLVTIDTLFKEKDTNNVLSFIDKIQETRLSRDDINMIDVIDDNKMYEFVRKYYRNQIIVPYNKKYFNRIHLFDLYTMSSDNKVKYTDLITSYYTTDTFEENREYYQEEDGSWLNKFQYYVKYVWKFPLKALYYNGVRLELNQPALGNEIPVNQIEIREIDENTLDEGVKAIELIDPRAYVSFEKLPNEKMSIDSAQENTYGSMRYHNILPFDESKPIQFQCIPFAKNYNDGYGLSTFYCIISEKVFDNDEKLISWNQIEDNEFVEWLQSITFTSQNEAADLYDSLTLTNMLYTPSEIKYEYNNNPMNIGLYSTFFPENLDKNKNHEFVLNLKEKVPYDVYLMHDKYDPTNSKKAYWYIVLISKYPIGNYEDESLLDISLNTEYIVDNFKIKYSGFSMDKFLVNRMDIQKSNGYNHFNKDDMLIVSINNNDYQFNIDLTNKWKIDQIYDPSKNSTVNSNSNIMIIPTNNFDQTYSEGYYNIQLNYVIDGINTEEQICKGYYRINKTYEECNYDKYSYDDFFDESDYFVSLKQEGIYNWQEIDQTIIEVEKNDTLREFRLNISNEEFDIESSLNIQCWKSDPSMLDNDLTIFDYLDITDVTGEEKLEKALNSITKIIIGKNVKTIKSRGFNNLNNINGCEIYISSTVNKIILPLNIGMNNISYIRVHPDNKIFDSRKNCNAIFLSIDDNIDPIHVIITARINDEFTFLNKYKANTLVFGCKNTFIPYERQEKYIAEYALYGIKFMEYLDVSDDVTYIGYYSLCNMPDLTILHLGTNVELIHVFNAISNNPKLYMMYIRAKVPPMAFNISNGLTPIESQILINNKPYILVPYGCGETYMTHPCWKFYMDMIREIAPISYDNEEEYIELLKQDMSLLGNFEDNNKFIPYNENNISNNIFNDLIFKYEDMNNNIIENFKEFNYIELCSFNEYNISPYLAKKIGVYYNNERLGEISIETLHKDFGERKYRVGLMSDVHYNDSTVDNNLATIDYDGSEYETDLPNALLLYQNKEDVKFICAAGDISSNYMVHMLNFKKALETYSPTTKFYSCYGNHDFASAKNESIPENEMYDTTGMNGAKAWNDIMIPNNSNYTLHYQDETTELGKASYWFEVPIEGTNKSDIYIFLSVNYDNNDSTATKILTSGSPNIQPLIDYVGFMPSRYNIQLYDNLTLIWFKELLEQFSNKRVFVFTHLFFVHKAGSNNIDNGYYHYGGIGDRWRIVEESAYCPCGIQFEFLNKLNNEYKNTIWFTGHSHLKWNWQTVDPNVNINDNEYNIYRPDDTDFVEDMHYLRKSNTPISKSGFNVHLPSTCRPLKIDNEYTIAGEDSEGAIMDVYENYIDIRGIIFKDSNEYTNKYYPLSQYRINIKAK